MAEALLRCDHLVRLYDTDSGRVQAVRGVDLQLAAGVSAAIIGPSGSGKSSLLRMLAGLDRPTAGSVHLDGIDLWGLSARRRAVVRARVLTMVRQEPRENLHPHLSARQQLERAARGGARRLRGGTVREAVERWLAALGLTARADADVELLSGGEQQRLAFGRAAVAGHRVVIADEPTSLLDGASAAAVLDGIDRLREDGVTVLLATHDPRVLPHLDQVVLLRDGAIATITEAGSARSVIDGSGRVQLPPEVLAHFPDRRVHLRLDAARGRVILDRHDPDEGGREASS